jgi:two-component system response regulator AtoC
MTQRPLVLVCDDEELIRWSLCEHLESEGYQALSAENGQKCLELAAAEAPAVIVMDLKMPVLDGLSALRRLREGGNEVPVIMITAHGAVDSAIEATRLGASGYLAKPFDLREVTLAVNKALADAKLELEVRYLRNRVRGGYGEFIGQAPSLRELFDTLARLEAVDAPTVLLQGESGTGKDVIARAIHARGPRRDQPFMEVDCASLPETLIESELFGHERGSFTDARYLKRGLFEVAANGIVFLDEIGEISLNTQAKLLRALENRRFKRVGGVANLALDAGVIAATNRNLKEEVKAGRFREDLYFRLNVMPIRIPPLRERKEDLPLLVAQFLERFNQQFRRQVPGMTAGAMQQLQTYGWPGNVRELRNVLERLVILAGNEAIDVDDLPAEIRWARPSAPPTADDCPFTLPENGINLEAVERGLIAQALARSGNNQSHAAKLLGLTRYTLRYRLEKYGLRSDPSAS